MKTNAIYFLILTCLLTFTYFFQELKERKSFNEKDRREILFNEKEYGPFMGFSLNGIEFEKGKNGKFTTKINIPISQEKISKVLKVLAGLRIEKIFPKFERDTGKKYEIFFPRKSQKITFKFKNNSMTFILGNKLTYSQSFYFKVQSGKKNILGIANDVSEFKALYQKENYENSSKRYNRLSNILSLKEKYFIEKKILDQFSKVEQVRFEGVGGEKFSLNLGKKSTTPPHFEGLAYSRAKFNVFKNDLMGLKASSILKNWQRENLSKKLVTMIFLSNGRVTKKLELFGQYENEKGFFVLNSGKTYLYKMDQNDLLPFVVSVQDFWLLNPLKKVSSKNKNPLMNGPKKDLKKQSDKVAVSFLRGRPYKVCKGQSFNSEISFQFKDQGQSFQVFKTKEELIFVSDKNGVSYHYWINRKKLLQSKMERLMLSQR